METVRTSTESCEAIAGTATAGQACTECSSSSVLLSGSVAKMEKLAALTGMKSFPSLAKRIPVVSSQGKPLMPARRRRVELWVSTRKATPFVNELGIFCARLNVEPSGYVIQPVVIGVDPGSKKEGVSVLTELTDLIHIQLDAKTKIKEKLESRAILRRARRGRNTPCRVNRSNRSMPQDRIPPSTKARWDWKLTIVKALMRVYPIAKVVIEDIKATTKKGQHKWNRSFSPLEAGKTYFANQIGVLNLPLVLIAGYETKALRDDLGLKKTSRKMDEVFDAHCVDSFVLALYGLGIKRQPTSGRLLCIAPLDYRRRALHLEVPAKGGLRRSHGGTRSMGFRRGTLVQHPRYGLAYVGGTSNERISLHSIGTGKRLTKVVRPSECKFVSYNALRWHWR